MAGSPLLGYSRASPKGDCEHNQTGGVLNMTESRDSISLQAALASNKIVVSIRFTSFQNV